MDQLVLLDGLDFFAQVQIGFGQMACGDHIPRVELEGFGQHLDSALIVAPLAEDSPQAHPA